MKDIQVISEWKKKAVNLEKGCKRVMAIVTDEQGNKLTKHLDIK